MKYDEIVKKRQDLKALEAGLAGDDFWEEHEAFRMILREALKDRGFISNLEPAHLFRFISLCSTFRPYEPHAILSMLSSCVGG